MTDQLRPCHACGCTTCAQGTDREAARYHAAINAILRELDERRRRHFAGLLASEHGRGGVSLLAQITGLSRTTILRGQRELEHGLPRRASGTRRPGGGRPRAEKKLRPS
jgi:hypothetical protein